MACPLLIIYLLLGEPQVENKENVYLEWYYLFLESMKID
jgi:hypothetical protein